MKLVKHEWQRSCSIKYLFDSEHVAQIWQLIIDYVYIRLLQIFEYDFLSDCPSLLHGIAICYVQHCQTMLECAVCELAHSFFHYGIDYCRISIVHGGSMFVDFVVTLTHEYLTKYELSFIVMQQTSPHKMTSTWTSAILLIH